MGQKRQGCHIPHRERVGKGNIIDGRTTGCVKTHVCMKNKPDMPMKLCRKFIKFVVFIQSDVGLSVASHDFYIYDIQGEGCQSVKEQEKHVIVFHSVLRQVSCYP